MGAADEELAGDQQREVTQGLSQDFCEGVSQEPRCDNVNYDVYYGPACNMCGDRVHNY